VKLLIGTSRGKRCGRRRCISLAIFCVHLCLSLVVFAQAWREKAPVEWTLEEMLEILRHSPWAQEKFILIPTGRLTRYPIAVGQKRVASGSEVPERLPAVYLVRWESAATVEQAFTRLAALEEATVAKFLSEPPRLQGDYYVLTCKAKEPPESSRYELFARFKAVELRERAELKAEHGAPAKPTLVLRTGVGANAAVHFYFPRQVNEQPLLTPGDTWVEFRFRGRHTAELKVKFRLSDIGLAPASAQP